MTFVSYVMFTRTEISDVSFIRVRVSISRSGSVFESDVRVVVVDDGKNDGGRGGEDCGESEESDGGESSKGDHFDEVGLF